MDTNTTHPTNHVSSKPASWPEALDTMRQIPGFQGLTAENFGKKLGVTVSTFYRWKRGQELPNAFRRQIFVGLFPHLDFSGLQWGTGLKTVATPVKAKAQAPKKAVKAKVKQSKSSKKSKVHVAGFTVTTRGLPSKGQILTRAAELGMPKAQIATLFGRGYGKPKNDQKLRVLERLNGYVPSKSKKSEPVMPKALPAPQKKDVSPNKDARYWANIAVTANKILGLVEKSSLDLEDVVMFLSSYEEG